jgi:hypothetical protein
MLLLLCSGFTNGVVLGGKEGYNTFVTICFMGEEKNHYVPQSGYIITKVDGPLKILKLEALIKTFTLK